MYKSYCNLLLLFLFITIFSCEDESFPYVPPSNENPVAVDFTENFGSQINAGFFGQVVDENQSPIENVTITIGNVTATTDAFGVFSINSASAFENFAYVTAEKQGYITGSRTLIPAQNEINQIKIILIEKDIVETIDSGQASTVNLPNGSSVSFDGNFVTAQGTPYNGLVNVIFEHLSPDNSRMTDMMPGMLYAQNTQGNAVVLETYGMLAVELESTGGEPLQLAQGSRSIITIPLPNNASNPPSSIPLWYFDEADGYWKEEGQASLQGNTYVGEVSHFTFWNYDFPYPPINLCITLRDENGNVLPNTALDLYSSLLNVTGTYGFTNANGVECGLVPADEELTVTVFGGICPGDAFTTTIGPFSFDVNITIVVESQDNITFTGNFLTCEGDNVTNGYVQITVGETSQTIPVTDGEVNFTQVNCGATSYAFQGIDVENSEITNVISGTIDDNTSAIDLGTFNACTVIEDADGDSVLDIFEDFNGDGDLENDDTDGDGVPNYLDEDDDGDGINTIDEDYDGDNDPTNDDTDGDGLPNYLDDDDLNLSAAETGGDGCEPVIYNFDALFANVFNVPNTDYVFYETEADAEAEINALTLPYTLPFAEAVLNPVIFVRATSTITGQTDTAGVFLFLNYLDTDNDGLTDCEEITGIDDPSSNLSPSGTSDPNDPNDPNAVPINSPDDLNLELCDDNNDGSTTVDLSLYNSHFIGTANPVDYVITYHSSEIDAVNNINPLPILYQNISNPEILFVRITEAINTNNFDIALLTLEVIAPPVSPVDFSITECDGDGDGFATFDLTTAEEEVLALNSDVEITFIDPANNPIVDLQAYTETSGTVSVEIVDIISGCITIAILELIVDSGC
ncbi:MAG: carboxypeptidase regulatory-like domain-containing protein [Winogradskyella sp.]|uniref:carboxypeptidase-like regulatory domain-containing protein n=1 Tax=Winogradskyella sp. TaxID=1883156 RepID=UPI000F40E582|nr:carboxypeptidase-like regulatory domain-containing protein [Winogradskyella sp.]RNC88148.1 MAG: carboxypeptidase regulatory-like domain-containing protein [Winogradskyella sp.]